ncbi:acyltransferase family protein [Brenneria goodwinii]|uniref:acyltransferase family protein n=1 Tax=Brenneria goodwinii TaxID=1109412 RepID=UPI0036E3CFE5
MEEGRDFSIDFLRCVGLLLIILAHVAPPGVIFQLRNFDVPLMVFVSGLSYAISSKDKSYFPYIVSRTKRLILPVWIFITIFYMTILYFSPPLFEKYNSFSSYMNTIAFKNGGEDNAMGYTWIIRIFLLIAIIAPFIKKMTYNMSQTIILMIATFVLLLNQYIVFKSPTNGDDNTLREIIFNYISPCLAYGVIFLFGVNYKKITPAAKSLIIIIFLFVFSYFLFEYKINFGRFISTQGYKYPPSIYYLSYSIMAIFILCLFTNRILITFPDRLKKIFIFISSNSIWIYLWHIPVVEYFACSSQQYNFMFKYSIACSIAILIMLLQSKLVIWICSKMSLPVAKNVKSIFTG